MQSWSQLRQSPSCPSKWKKAQHQNWSIAQGAVRSTYCHQGLQLWSRNLFASLQRSHYRLLMLMIGPQTKRTTNAFVWSLKNCYVSALPSLWTCDVYCTHAHVFLSAWHITQYASAHTYPRAHTHAHTCTQTRMYTHTHTQKKSARIFAANTKLIEKHFQSIWFANTISVEH